MGRSIEIQFMLSQSFHIINKLLLYSPDGSSDSEGVVILLQSHSRPGVLGKHGQQWIGWDTLAPMFMN